MSCAWRYCQHCGYFDERIKRGDCPKCGERLDVEWDERGDHDDHGDEDNDA